MIVRKANIIKMCISCKIDFTDDETIKELVSKINKLYEYERVKNHSNGIATSLQNIKNFANDSRIKNTKNTDKTQVCKGCNEEFNIKLFTTIYSAKSKYCRDCRSKRRYGR